MRFHPTIVPSPSAIATATLTQSGMNLVAASVSFLYASSTFQSLALIAGAPDFFMRRSASPTRNMSLRKLWSLSPGTFFISL